MQIAKFDPNPLVLRKPRKIRTLVEVNIFKCRNDQSRVSPTKFVQRKPVRQDAAVEICAYIEVDIEHHYKFRPRKEPTSYTMAPAYARASSTK